MVKKKAKATTKRKVSTKPIRKYRNSEVNLNMSTSQYVVRNNSQLKDWEKLKEQIGYEDSHIYLITRRPRVSLDTNNLLYEHGMVKGEFEIHNTNSRGVSTLDFEYKDAFPNKRFTSEYPHSELTIYDFEKHKEVSKMDVTRLMRMLWKHHECLNLEVLYVGQSYADGKRESAQRLQSHKTLQKVLGDVLETTPNHVVEMVLLSFNDESYSILFDGISQNVETSEDEDKAHFEKVFSTPISLKSKINTIELALIRYFQPSYNILLKDKYKPVGYYKTSLRNLYDLDLNQATVLLNLYTDSDPTNELLLFSDEVQPSSQHIITLNLHDPAERKQLDDFFN